MTNAIAKFHQDEDGAVTVDWVLITGIALGLAFATVVAVRNGATGLAAEISSTVSVITPDMGAD